MAETCPIASDLASGVEVDYSDGRSSIITRDASGEVRETEEFGGDSPYVYIAANGVLETGFIDPDTKAQDSFTYTFPTDDLLPLQPWSSQKGEQVTTDPAGNEINRIPFEYRTRGVTTYQIGGCVYDAIPLETYYYEPGDPSMVEFIYLVDLGIPVTVGYSYLTGGISGAETALPVAIRAAAETE